LKLKSGSNVAFHVSVRRYNMVRVAFLSVANPYIGHSYSEVKKDGKRRRSLLGGSSSTKYHRSKPMFARSSLYAVCRKTHAPTTPATPTADGPHGHMTKQSEPEAEVEMEAQVEVGAGSRSRLGGWKKWKKKKKKKRIAYDIYDGRVDPGIAKVSDTEMSKTQRQKIRWKGDQFEGEGCEVRFGGVGLMDDPDDASLKYMGDAAEGRGLSSSTFQLNLSRLRHKMHPRHPMIPPDTH